MSYICIAIQCMISSYLLLNNRYSKLYLLYWFSYIYNVYIVIFEMPMQKG